MTHVHGPDQNFKHIVYDISNVSLWTLQLTQPDLQPLDAARVPFRIKLKLNSKHPYLVNGRND